ncbi:hypothetical protein C2W64_04364 [Brevibacillus laterosporus]|nr:hypothetical protein C2W64_04364 [Brevibacillus laterosporus]
MIETSRKPTREDLKIQSKENLQKLSRYFCEGHPFHVAFQIGLHTGVRVGEVQNTTLEKLVRLWISNLIITH